MLRISKSSQNFRAKNLEEMTYQILWILCLLQNHRFWLKGFRWWARKIQLFCKTKSSWARQRRTYGLVDLAGFSTAFCIFLNLALRFLNQTWTRASGKFVQRASRSRVSTSGYWITSFTFGWMFAFYLSCLECALKSLKLLGGKSCSRSSLFSHAADSAVSGFNNCV